MYSAASVDREAAAGLVHGRAHVIQELEKVMMAEMEGAGAADRARAASEHLQKLSASSTADYVPGTQNNSQIRFVLREVLEFQNL